MSHFHKKITDVRKGNQPHENFTSVTPVIKLANPESPQKWLLTWCVFMTYNGRLFTSKAKLSRNFRNRTSFLLIQLRDDSISRMRNNCTENTRCNQQQTNDNSILTNKFSAARFLWSTWTTFN